MSMLKFRVEAILAEEMPCHIIEVATCMADFDQDGVIRDGRSLEEDYNGNRY